MRSDRKVTKRRPEPGAESESFSSPLLREIIEKLTPDTRQVILLPGTVVPNMLGALEGTRCRLVVCDAAAILSGLDDDSQDVDGLAERIQGLLLSAGAEKIDTVLCWDLLNYLNPPLLQLFAARLVSIMSPGGRLHAYIHSASSDMPQFPQRYDWQADEQLVCFAQAPAVRKTPRYSYGDLEKHLGGFRVARSVLLRNGLQEYLLRLDAN